MKSVPLASALTPNRIEPADLLRAHRREGAPMLTVAALSRALSVIALSGCAVVAFAVARGSEPTPAGAPTAADKPAVADKPTKPAAREATGDVRLVYGNPDAPRGGVRPAEAPTEPIAPVAAPPQPVAPAPVAVAAAEPPPVEAPATFEAAPPQPEAAVGPGVDLNTASVEQLNGLNAGMIGRAIVRGRPYAAPSELVERRILTRANFERIKDRVAVAR